MSDDREEEIAARPRESCAFVVRFGDTIVLRYQSATHYPRTFACQVK
jgi:hypothetical protein